METLDQGDLKHRAGKLYRNLSNIAQDNPYLVIVLVTVTSTLLVYLPFLASGSMDYVFRHWDGPNYALVAKSLYTIPHNHPLSAYTSPEYFAAHLPVYPLSIRLFSFLGYLNAMLVVNILYTAAAAVVFYRLLIETRLVDNPLWSALISLFIPVRYLLNHSIGATEPTFLFFTLSSLLAYIRGNYLLAFLLGGISGITRITGILIGGAYFITLVSERKWKYIPALALVALPLLGTFTFYAYQYGDFFAYFGTNYSDSNKLIHFQPFTIFSVYSNAGESHSAELYLILYAIYGVGTALLWKKHKLLFWFSAITFAFSCFIFHQDVSRYLIPMAPLAIVVAYDAVLSQKAVKLAFVAALFLAYTYVWGIIPHNVVDTRSYMKLQTYLSGGPPPSKHISSNFESIRINACEYQKCDSKIYDEISGEKFDLARGLNVFALSQENKLVFIKNYDHCTQNHAFRSGLPLLSTVNEKMLNPNKILLVSSDTVVCNRDRLRGINWWGQKMSLPKLKNIRFRQTYIGIVDVSTFTVEEYSDRTTINYPL